MERRSSAAPKACSTDLLRSSPVAISSFPKKRRPIARNGVAGGPTQRVASDPRPLASGGHFAARRLAIGSLSIFELYDLANVRCARQLCGKELAGELSVTPPMKAALEEKMWFALFWLKPLESFWRRELGERAMLALRKVIPYTWLVDPEPLPRHAVLPRLETHTWDEVAHFSQKQRALILKISGFSEHAWGSRGVVVAQDMSQTAWKAKLESAWLSSAPTRISSSNFIRAAYRARLP